MTSAFPMYFELVFVFDKLKVGVPESVGLCVRSVETLPQTL